MGTPVLITNKGHLVDWVRWTSTSYIFNTEFPIVIVYVSIF